MFIIKILKDINVVIITSYSNRNVNNGCRSKLIIINDDLIIITIIWHRSKLIITVNGLIIILNGSIITNSKCKLWINS